MPRQPLRNEASGTGDEARCASQADASGDSASYTVHCSDQNQRSRSKNKIPKSVRYDLENALVSLCDIWFEEIKPHLVHNNVKLHVHGQESTASASGDFERLPPGAINCSHRDPGAASDNPRPQNASYADCCIARLTALRARCRRPRVVIRQPQLPPLPSLPTSPQESKQNQPHKCEEKKLELEQPRTQKKKRKSYPQSQLARRVPRLCQTYHVLSTSPSTWKPDNYYVQFIGPRRRHVKNKRIQTLPLSAVNEASPTPPKSMGPSLKKHSRPRLASSAGNEICPKRPSMLFQDDLIDIIGESNDKRLQLLCNRLDTEASELMRLYPNNLHGPGSKKIPPWK